MRKNQMFSLAIKTWVLMILFTLLALQGCSILDEPTKENSWVGHTESEIIDSWGQPDVTYHYETGEKTYTWITTSAGEYGPYTCQKSVTFDKKQLIKKRAATTCPSVPMPSGVLKEEGEMFRVIDDLLP